MTECFDRQQKEEEDLNAFLSQDNCRNNESRSSFTINEKYFLKL